MEGLGRSLEGTRPQQPVSQKTFTEQDYTKARRFYGSTVLRFYSKGKYSEQVGIGSQQQPESTTTINNNNNQHPPYVSRGKIR